jgi:uncharacterized protein YjbI with pentapeptide repeats
MRNLVGADIIASDFVEANLSDANLRDALLFRADLHCTHLNGANLDNADLSGADLTWAFGVTEEQLAESQNLSNATMPNGQKYKDWLKDEQSQGENREDFKNIDRTQLGTQGPLYPCKEPGLEPWPGGP